MLLLVNVAPENPWEYDLGCAYLDWGSNLLFLLGLKVLTRWPKVILMVPLFMRSNFWLYIRCSIAIPSMILPCYFSFIRLSFKSSDLLAFLSICLEFEWECDLRWFIVAFVMFFSSSSILASKSDYSALLTSLKVPFLMKSLGAYIIPITN